jgi:hypothetical protein
MPSGHRPPIPPGVARVALLGTTQGHQWTNVFYLQLSGSGIVAADLTTLATTIANSWNTNWAPNINPSVILTKVEIVYIPSVGNEVVGAVTVSHPGTRAGVDIQNAGSSWVLNWLISAYYRGGHPRMYLAAPVVADVTNGSSLSPSDATNVTNAWLNIRSAIDAATTTNITAVLMGTLSYQTGNAWRTTPLFRPYTGCSTRTVMGSQRRRILS